MREAFPVSCFRQSFFTGTARVGEQGNGFAVVADEIRRLAEQSSEAVINIGSMVDKVQEAVANFS